jgi:hypothetical protein
MDTMNKSVQSMNLEKVLSELKVLKSSTSTISSQSSSSETIPIGQQPEPITAGMSFKAPATTSPTVEKDTEVFGYVPQKKKKKDEEDEPHLMRPSDLFK